MFKPRTARLRARRYPDRSGAPLFTADLMLTEADPCDAGFPTAPSPNQEAEREAREKHAARAEDLNRQQRELIRTAIERMAKRSSLLEDWRREPR